MRQVPEDTQEEIMTATMDALKKHGYAELTTQRIADEFDKSQSLIHYYYDTKENVVAAFLEHYTETIKNQIEEIRNESSDPRQAIDGFIDLLLVPDEDEARDFGVAQLEIQARASRTPAYRKEIEKMNQVVESALIEVIEEGIEDGVFNRVDPEETAFIISSTAAGANINDITMDESLASKTRQVLEKHVLDDLIDK